MMETLVDQLQDEAGLCRSEGADDIAGLLDEAAARVAELKAEREALRAQLQAMKLDEHKFLADLNEKLKQAQWMAESRRELAQKAVDERDALRKENHEAHAMLTGKFE